MHLCGQHKARNHLTWPANTVAGTGSTASYATHVASGWPVKGLQAPLHLAHQCYVWEPYSTAFHASHTACDWPAQGLQAPQHLARHCHFSGGPSGTSLHATHVASGWSADRQGGGWQATVLQLSAAGARQGCRRVSRLPSDSSAPAAGQPHNCLQSWLQDRQTVI